ncbi:MAG: thioredoxin-dependent thiol peroxidase [Bacteroidota bacterium]|jgi:peroxiredoxin Q/BCP
MTQLAAGQKAPHFEALNQDGKTLRLSDFSGRKLVLYFYPKDDTPGCTAEACNLRDNYNSLIDAGYAVLGVSPDDPNKHRKFIDKFELPFDLLADTEQTVANAYGVWVEKSMYGRKYLGMARTTFVIDGDGTILEVIEKVDTKNHTAQIL